MRNLDAGRAAKQSIEQRLDEQAGADESNAPANSKPVIEVWPPDLSSHDSIAALAQRATHDLDRLDVAVLNAGVYEVTYGISQYGWERTVQVNALSTALLGLLLLSKLRETGAAASSRKRMQRDGGAGENRRGPAVLQAVTSRRAEAVQIPDEMRTAGNVLEVVSGVGEAGYKPSEQYRMSKLLVMAVVKKLASFVDTSEATVTAVCPGGVATNLSLGWAGVGDTVVKSILNTLLLRTPEYAARSVVSGTSLGSEASGLLRYDDELHD